MCIYNIYAYILYVHIYGVNVYICMFIYIIFVSLYAWINLRYYVGNGKAFCYLNFPSVTRPEQE